MSEESCHPGITPRGLVAGSGKLFLAMTAIAGLCQWVVGMPDELRPWHAWLAGALMVGFWGLVGVVGRRTARVGKGNTRPVASVRGPARQSVPEEEVVGLALTNLEGRLVTCNRTFQEMLGYSEEEMRGRNLTEFSPPRDVPEAVGRFQALVEGRCDHYEVDKRYRRKDGRVVWGHVRVSCVRDAEGHPQFAVGLVEPIPDYGEGGGRGTSLVAGA